MVTLDMIRKPVEGDLEAFEQFIRQKFTADGTLLSEMLDYALSARGKGIRPMTVLLSAALNAPAGQRSGGLRALLAATLVEMIHVASLIHDDVIDESDMRRGRASVNARWQSRNAVVVGDYILAKNMDLGLKSGQFDLVTHVCGAIATLCEGEILQNDKANRQEMTRAAFSIPPSFSTMCCKYSTDSSSSWQRASRASNSLRRSSPTDSSTVSSGRVTLCSRKSLLEGLPVRAVRV